MAVNIEMRSADELLDKIIKDIEEHCFRVAVVGEFRRGKSTFINALLGRAVLPSDILPTTATLNRVTYGDHPHVLIRFKKQDGQAARTEEVPLHELTNYVTKITPTSESIAATVEEAVISYPTPYCRRNVDIIDTPGLNDDATMTAITKSILHKVHAAIMIISATAPFSESEANFLDHLLEHGLGKVIFVASRIDQVEADERAVVLQHITSRIQKRLTEIAYQRFGDNEPARDKFIHQVGTIHVFGVSGLQALRAKENNDESLRSSSGFDEMETALKRILSVENDLIALQTWMNHLLSFAEKVDQQISQTQAHDESYRRSIKSSYEVSAQLTEVLRQMAQHDIEVVNKTQSICLGRIQDFGADLQRNVVNGLEDLIGHYPIEVNDYAPQHNESFHINLAIKMQAVLTEAIKEQAEIISRVAADKLYELHLQLAQTATAYDRVMRHISAAIEELQRSQRASDAVVAIEKVCDCSAISAEQLEEEMALPSHWLNNVFNRARLPTGEFNLISRKLKESAFRGELKQHAVAEIKTQLQAQVISQKALGLVAHTFWERKNRVEQTKVCAEETQLKLHSVQERCITTLDHRFRELTAMREKIGNIVRENSLMMIH